MAGELDSIVADVAGERYAKRGVTAFRRGGTVVIVKDGFARAMVAWVGGERFVITCEDGDAWQAEEVTREDVAMVACMTYESIAYA